MANGLVRELHEVRTAGAPAEVDARRDVRARRPLLFASILRLDTLRRLARVVTLGALDAAGVFLAHLHRARGQADRPGAVEPRRRLAARRRPRAARGPRHAPAVRPLRPLRRPRAAARASRGSSRRSSRSRVVLFVYALVEGDRLLVVLHLLRHALLRALLRLGVPLGLRARSAARCCAPPATTAAPCSSAAAQHIDAVAHALRGHARSKPIGFVSLEPRKENGLKDMGPLEKLERHFDVVDEVLIADPDFPQDRAVELIDTLPPPRRSRCASRRRRWRS